MRLLAFITTIALACLLAGCKKSLPEERYPEGFAKGSFVTSVDLRLLSRERVKTHGHDYYLKVSAPSDGNKGVSQGGRKTLADISVPAGTTIRIDDLIRVAGTGVHDWYATGEVSDTG